MESTLTIKSILENEQIKLQSKINLENKIDIRNLHIIAGVDLAYCKQEDKEYA